MASVLSPQLADIPCIVCSAIERDKYGKCLPCNRKRCREWSANNRRRKRPKDVNTRAYMKWRHSHPDRDKAQRAVQRAVKSEKLVKAPMCQLCWDVGQRLEGHHVDYSKQLEVVWLCRACHCFVDGHKLRDNKGRAAS
jgi:hypothetical protein